MSKTGKMWACIVLLSFVLAGCASMPVRPAKIERGDYTPVKEYISRLAGYEMKKYDITGLSIALVDDQRVIWAEGFGFADKAGNVPATADTIYRAGSVSKLFTATAAMQLAEQGKLDIDKPLQTFLPEFSVRSRFPDAGPITPRTIMTHHSGLPSDMLKGMWSRTPEPFENLATQLREEDAAYPPNFVFSYSNVGVSLLGHALEKVSGLDFASLMTRTLLLPLGMSHSSFQQAADHSPLAAKAYRDGREVEETPLRDVPAGGLNSTVLDLSRFMEMIFAGGRAGERQIVGSGTLAEMLRVQNADVPLDLGFRTGLGWALGGLGKDMDFGNAGPVAHHSGATQYHHSMLIILPEQKIGVVALTNSSTGGNTVDKLAAETLKLALEAKTGTKQPERKIQEQGGAMLSRDELQAWEGTYASIVGVVSVGNKTDYLRAEAMNSALRLVPRPGRALGLQYRLLGLFPISLDELDNVRLSRATVAGRDIVKASIYGKEMLVGEQIRKVSIPEKWLRRTGEYEIANLGNDAVMIEKPRLRSDNGLLIMDYGIPLFTDKRLSVAIKPLSDTEAVIYGLGRGMGETIRAVTVDGEEMLQYSGYLFRKTKESSNDQNR